MSDLLERMFGEMPSSEYRGYNVGYGNSDPMKALFPRQQQEPAKKWWAQDVQERQKTLSGEQEKLAGLQQQTGLAEAFKPILNVLQVVGGILNIPGAAISSAAMQFLDKKPGFNTQEYFKGIFNFKDQMSWRNIIGMLAEDDPNKNMWDKKWSQIVFGLILDIGLDPTTYFGRFIFKFGKNESKALSDLATEVLKKLPEDEAYRALKYIKRAQRPFGIGIPFSQKGLVSFASQRTKDITGIAERTGKLLGKYGPEAVEKAGVWDIAGKQLGKIAKTFNPVQVFGNKIKEAIPAVKLAMKAFDPYKQAHVSAVIAKAEAAGEKAAGLRKLSDDIIKLSTENKNGLVREATGLAEEMPYYGAVAVANKIEFSDTLRKLLLAQAKGDKSVAKFSKVLQKNREDFYTFLRGRLGEDLGKGKSPAEIVSKFGDMIDGVGARQMMGSLKRMGVEPGDLVSMAKAEFVVDKEKAFAKMSSTLSEADKKSVLNLIQQAEGMNTAWWDAEYNAGRIWSFKRNYMMHPWGTERVGVVKELEGVFKPALKRMDKISYLEKYKNMKEMLSDWFFDKNGFRPSEKVLRQEMINKVGMYDNILEALYIRGRAHYAEMSRYKIIEDMKTMGKKWDSKVMPMGYSDIPNIEELKGLVFEPQTAKFLNNTLSVVASDTNIKQFLKMIDRTQSWWKRLVLLYPGYHFRNMYSNALIGVSRHGMLRYGNLRTHSIAGTITGELLIPEDKALRTILKVTDKHLDDVVAGIKVKDLVEQLRNTPMASKSSFMTAEGTLKNAAGLEKRITKLVKKYNPLGIYARASDVLGGVIETRMRIASFLIDLEDTRSVKMATLLTQEAFVDYNNITEFERQIMRRVVPFWTWLSRNVKNQVKFIFTQPGKMAMYPRVADAIEAGATWKMPDNERPEYFRDLWMWQLPMLLPNGDPLFFNPNFPVQDLNKLDVRYFGRNVLANISPFIKVPLELMSGEDVYRKRPIEAYKGYRAPVPGILHSIAKVLPEGTQKMLGIEKDEKGIMRMNPYTAHAIANLLPFINTSARLFMQEPSPQGMEKYFQFISTTIGIKIKPVDRLTRQWESTRKKIEDEKAKLKKMGIDVRWNSYRKEWTRME
jgi:hypothetical protein